MYSWDTNWPFSLGPTIGILLAVSILTIGGYLGQYWRAAQFAETNGSAWKRLSALLTLRLIAIGLLVWMLAGATLTKFISTPADIWFVVDRSASMLQADERQGSAPVSRIDRSIDVINDLSKALERKGHSIQLKYFTIGNRLQETDLASLDKIGESTDRSEFDQTSRLGNSMDELLRKSVIDQPQAIFILTDGRITEGISLSSIGTSLPSSESAKLFVLSAGRVIRQPLLEIVDVDPPSMIFVGDEVKLSVLVHTTDLAGQKIALSLQDSITGEQLATLTTAIDQKNQIVRGVLTFVANKAGAQNCRLNASVVAAEQKAWPVAQKSINLQVRETPLPVLVIAQNFSYEVRFLKHFLERTKRQGDSNQNVFAPTFCVTGAERRFVKADSTMVPYLPAEKGWWDKFETCVVIDPSEDVIDPILARVMQSAVADQGMGVVFVAGRSGGAAVVQKELWKRLLPVQQAESTDREAMQIQFTAQSKSFGIDLTELLATPVQSSLPELSSVGAIFRPTATASVLAEDGSAPFLLTQFVGAGQVYFQATDETYRWRAFGGDESIFNAYWTELICSAAKSSRSLNGQPPMVVKSSKDERYEGEKVDLSLDVAGSGNQIDSNAIPILIESVDATKSANTELVRSADANIFRGSVVIPDAGKYAIRLDHQRRPDWKYNLTGQVNVESRPTEFIDKGPDVESLEQFASKQAGVYASLGDWQQIIDQLPPEKVLHFEPMPPKSIWNYPLLVATIVGLLGTEWYLRNRWGLI